MKIVISEIEIDTKDKDYEDCFDLGEVLSVAMSNAKRQIRQDIEAQIKRELLSDPLVEAYIRDKKQEMIDEMGVL